MGEVRIGIRNLRKGISKQYRVLFKPDFERSDYSNRCLQNYINDLAEGKLPEFKPPGVLSIEEIIEP